MNRVLRSDRPSRTTPSTGTGSCGGSVSISVGSPRRSCADASSACNALPEGAALSTTSEGSRGVRGDVLAEQSVLRRAGRSDSAVLDQSLQHAGAEGEGVDRDPLVDAMKHPHEIEIRWQ